MSKLVYTKENKRHCLESTVYEINSPYADEKLYTYFVKLKMNICDLNPALITKAITGCEQDFISIMNRATDFLKTRCQELNAGEIEKVLSMFQECVFGYYVLTPLLLAKDVSDIKIYSYDHITVKACGKRYVTKVKFIDEADYNAWYERIMRIQKKTLSEENALTFCTDRKGVEDFYLRLDMQSRQIISSEKNNLHIRKIPNQKYSIQYLKDAGMIDDDIWEYVLDRIASGYGFLISGRGGSGKSTLLNNMLDVIPFDESVLVSQESDELYSNVHPQIQFEHTAKFYKQGSEIEFSLEDELRLGLLQDIDNFVIGEIKGGEALYVFTTAMSTGARFFGTIHSNDAASSVTRLAQCARYISDYPMETLEEMLTVMPFVLIHMSSFAVDEILEIDHFDDTTKRLVFRTIYKK